MEDVADDLDEAWERVFLSEQVGHEGRTDEARQMLEAILATYEPRASTDADVAHLLGYGLYVHPDRGVDEAIEMRCEAWLTRAIELDPGSVRSYEYLGYLRYDQSCFVEATSHFLRVLDADSEARCRVLEMLACCRAGAEGWGAALSDLEAYAACAEQHRCAEATPLTLAKMLRELPVPADVEDAVRDCLARIDRASGSADAWLTSQMRSRA